MILDRPPKDWKRPAIPTLVKLDVVIRQEGKCKQSGDKLGTLRNTQFDHRPAIWERKFDTVANDTVPPANDPAFIEACTIAGHKVRTHGNGATTVGSDSHRRAKIKRFTEPNPDKPKQKIPRRPFAAGRKFQPRKSA
jgi:hypothetical protein